MKQGKATGVPPSLTIDVPRVASLEQLKNLLGDIYFPNGRSTNGIYLCHQEVELGPYRPEEARLPEKIDGEPFTFEAFYNQNSRPIRIYLLTKVNIKPNAQLYAIWLRTQDWYTL